MKHYIAIFVFSICFLAYSSGQVEVSERNGAYYFSDRVVVKFNNSFGTGFKSESDIREELKGKIDLFEGANVKKRFNSPDLLNNELESIYVIQYSAPIDPYFVSSKLGPDDEIEWVEPYFLYETFLIPNDPFIGSQYALERIEAEAAWDINTGDPDIIIAINDTGVDWDHPDLADNIWQNDDPVNGIDDDGNGYVDDLRGWDFGGLTGTPDNDPMEDRPDHGTHVAGISAAVTNNGIGVASIGFNSTIMPVKTSQDNIRNNQGLALIAYGYDGLIYAADNGAKVINCSWGGFGYSLLGQEVVDYVVSKGALIVAAAGNDGLDDIIYPSGYDGVLSVGSTNSLDRRSGFSNYGTKLDVLAPGSAIYNTWQNNTYLNLNGTSMASPLAAGLAALVFSQYPDFSPLQVAEQVRINADNIDNLNPGLEYKLGAGRVNALEALSNGNSKSVRISDYYFVDEGDGDGVLEPGEDVAVYLDLVNYLSPTASLSITAETDNSNIQFINAGSSIGSVQTMSNFSNSSDPIRFSIDQSVPQNNKLYILVKYSDTDYSDFQWIETILNPTYSTQGANKVALTITSKGTLGFNDFPGATQGDGFKYDDGPNLLFEGALMYGISGTQVMNAARESQSQSDDFTTVTPFTIKVPGSVADQQGLTVFNDDGAGSNKLGITTTLTSYTFTDEEYEDFIILNYKLENSLGNAVNGLRAGLFFDWDLIDGSGDGDVVMFDETDNFSYVYNNAGGPETYVGVALLTEGDVGHYGIANGGGNGSFSIYDGFSLTEKWLSLSQGNNNPILPQGDISLVHSGGSYDIEPNGYIEVAFSIAAGNDLEELREAVRNSKIKYNSIITSTEEEVSEIPLEYSLSQNYPNPFNPATKIEFTIVKNENVSLKIFNILGERTATLFEGKLSRGKHSFNFNAENLTSGVYFYRLETENFVSTRKMILVK